MFWHICYFFGYEGLRYCLLKGYEYYNTKVNGTESSSRGDSIFETQNKPTEVKPEESGPFKDVKDWTKQFPLRITSIKEKESLRSSKQKKSKEESSDSENSSDERVKKNNNELKEEDKKKFKSEPKIKNLKNKNNITEKENTTDIPEKTTDIPEKTGPEEDNEKPQNAIEDKEKRITLAIFLTIVIIFTIVLSIIIYILYLRRKKKLREIEAKNYNDSTEI